MSHLSNLGPDDFLKGRRGVIYARIQEEPGQAFLDLHRSTGFHYGNLEYHLSVLERIGAVESFKVGRYRRYYAAGENHHRLKRIHALVSNPVYKQTVAVIQAAPGASQTEISRRLEGVSRQSVGYRLRRLESFGAVESKPAGRCVRYELTEDARFALNGAFASSHWRED